MGAEADPHTALTGLHPMKGAFYLKSYRSVRFGVQLSLTSSLVIRFTFLIIGNTGVRNWVNSDSSQTRFKVDSPQQFVFLSPLTIQGPKWPLKILSRRKYRFKRPRPYGKEEPDPENQLVFVTL